MLFNSFEFITFLLLVILIYWLIKQRFRWILLLFSSYFFYISWEPSYLVLILFSTSIDYFSCRFLTSSENLRFKKIGLAISIILNLGLLFSYKYFNFSQEIIRDLFAICSFEYKPHFSELLLPVGISFYTFQTLSYSIDVYRNEINCEKHFGKFALYVSFFPQLIAGPIERAKGLLSQLNKKVLSFDFELFRAGLMLILWGLFKKVVVADNAQLIADHYFNNSEFQTGGSLLFATFLFTIQLYADFSGYSDIAIGTAKLMGIELSSNFKTPYFSQNITEFWKRWHITLSQWLRDYVYIPLGGNRGGKMKHLRNLFITFFLAGVWHGASWNFVLWGILHAALIIIENILGLVKISSNNWLGFARICLTFLIIMLTMIPVRTDNIGEMNAVIHKLIQFSWSDFYFAIVQYKLSAAAIGIVVLFIVEIYIARDSITSLLNKHLAIQYSWAISMILFILLLGDNSGDAFFYFQF